ncbi:hypothetical protein H1R17_11390 [Flavobacterium sp. xlx-214]|uniref:hypothetical protein n=1 Tax=unclassified Flavobacterium TaxID=196869 RepID=UPI0013CFAE29|nr:MULTISPECIES: hypothetical protein [unclassified Flavobacterium]MBA5791819.1 hypothetical protein [Flavobacterium sp. xlx-221]QMI83056.1 hypothetical protein H1R17_11390 [Flavobacterium sp. xlx-214]
MENSNAQKIIKNLQAEVIANGFNNDTLIPELKKLREFALLEEKPVLVKALRLAYEHIESNNDFLVQIPSDEPIEDELATETTNTNTESFNYFMSLMLDLNNKHNIADLKDYNTQFQEF